MDRTSIIIAFTAPLLMALYGLSLLLGPRVGDFGDLAGAIVLMVAFIAAILVAVTVFFLRRRELRWWQALLLSFGVVIVGFGGLILFVRIADVMSGYA